MKILIIGGHGTIGRYLVDYFSDKHEVVTAGRTRGDFIVDMAQSNSIEQLFDQTGQLDAIIVVAGEAKWAPFNELAEEDYYVGFSSKLMGQVNVARYGRSKLSPGGSVTLSTGILADDPVRTTASAAMVNGALHSFVKAVALELEGVRINAVAAGVVQDSFDKYRSYFPGHNPVPMETVARAYERSVLGAGNGEIIRVY